MKKLSALLYKTITVILMGLLLSCSYLGGSGKGEMLGDEYTSTEGGFSIRRINGFSLDASNGVISMQAPDAEEEIGPMVLIMGGAASPEMTNEQLLEKMIQDTSVMEFSGNKKVTINGTKWLLANGKAEYEGRHIQGQMFVSIVNPGQQFNLIGFAPKERWKELEPLIAAVLKSVQFQEIDIESPTSQEVEGTGFLEETGPALLRQWAIKADASSSYSNPDWSASQATGEPNVETCGDNAKAWASESSNTEEWIELSYEIPVIPTEINIYQSYNPSQVVEVQMVDVEGNSYIAWTGDPEAVENCPDLMSIMLEMEEEIYINKVVVFIDQSIKGWGWAEIDAVELVGSPDGLATASDDADQDGESSAANKASESAYNPSDLDKGAFAYSISGYENDEILNDNVQIQSSDVFYTVGLISEDQRYTISLFLPKNNMKSGVINVEPYDATKAAKPYSAAIYINAFLYVADGGEYDIQSDPTSGILTGTFQFNAHSKDFPERIVSVSGAVNGIGLK